MSTENPNTTFSLADLLARQAQLRAWIEQLDTAADDVPSHVADRVRSDYEARLAGLVDQLRAHEGAVRADAERLQDDLQRAREEQERAQDELAEGKLRNRLGEWSSEEWESRRAELERIAAGAGSREEEVRRELARVEDLLFEMGDVAGPEPRLGEPAGDPADFLQDIDRALATPSSPAPPASPVTLVASVTALPPLTAVGGFSEEPDPDTRPTVGIKCPDCGYTNDSTAWYCGVCGVNLS
ncbi:MAG: hypothetical protein KY464_10055 [Gemmatimonadetes bacterium]|nr:hypothetical protein [Gemmatimonadota bacterium]